MGQEQSTGTTGTTDPTANAAGYHAPSHAESTAGFAPPPSPRSGARLDNSTEFHESSLDDLFGSNKES